MDSTTPQSPDDSNAESESRSGHNSLPSEASLSSEAGNERDRVAGDASNARAADLRKANRRRRMWAAVLIAGFLIAGMLVAVNVGEAVPESSFESLEKSPVDSALPGVAAPSPEEAERTTISAAATSTGSLMVDGDPDSLPQEAEKLDDLSGRLAGLISEAKIEAADHPLEPLLEVAAEAIRRIRRDVQDYTATVVSQVRIDGRLQPEKEIFCKIRHAAPPETDEAPDGEDAPTAGSTHPFSVYLLMKAPRKIASQEAIWIEGQNENNLIAHGKGVLNFKRFYIDPDSAMAMKGNRYPIYQIGLLKLIEKIHEVGVADLKHDDVSVDIHRDIEAAGTHCTVLEITHPQRKPSLQYHIARIYLDQRRDVLVGFEGYLWPRAGGKVPALLEKYFYTDLKLNVGLTDADFSPDNEEYRYPSW